LISICELIRENKLFNNDQISNNNDFFIESKIKIEFFNLLKNYYGRLLSTSHLKDKNQFTIFSSKTRLPIGILQINRGKNTFLQIALIPSLLGNGLAKRVIEKAIDNIKLKKIDWTAHKYNYPSLKLLKLFNGGIFDGQEKRENKEGFFRINKTISSNMIQNLDVAIKEAKKKFNLNDYINKSVNKKIIDYIQNYKKEIN